MSKQLGPGSQCFLHPTLAFVYPPRVSLAPLKLRVSRFLAPPHGHPRYFPKVSFGNVDVGHNVCIWYFCIHKQWRRLGWKTQFSLTSIKQCRTAATRLCTAHFLTVPVRRHSLMLVKNRSADHCSLAKPTGKHSLILRNP
jgi:hypothetical protein